MITIFKEKRIVLGVCGSIAVYKATDLASKLTQAGALVDVILTPAAEKFISPLTFQSVTGRKAYTETDLWGGQAHILHVELGCNADMLIIAPITANTIAKIAHGMADNLLTITALTSGETLLMAPAMDAGMYTHSVTQENIRLLTERGVYFAGPTEGRMASGLTGKGRMLESEDLLGHIRFLMGKKGKLTGRHFVITAGGTQEPIDPVRFISNRSSGKQGYALAQAAVDAGASVTLISAPVGLQPPIGVNLIPAETASDMLKAVLEVSGKVDALIMAAAVADFQPKKESSEKLKKRDGIPQILLESTPDILGMLASKEMKHTRPKVVVGFAAESRDLLENAAEKLKTKKLDLIAANNIAESDAGFGVDSNRVTLLAADGKSEILPLLSKVEVSELIIARISTLLESI